MIIDGKSYIKIYTHNDINNVTWLPRREYTSEFSSSLSMYLTEPFRYEGKECICYWYGKPPKYIPAGSFILELTKKRTLIKKVL